MSLCCPLPSRLHQCRILSTDSLIIILRAPGGAFEMFRHTRRTQSRVSAGPDPDLVQALQPQLRNSLPGCYCKQYLIIWGVSANILPLRRGSTALCQPPFFEWVCLCECVTERKKKHHCTKTNKPLKSATASLLMVVTKSAILSLSLNKYSTLVIIWVLCTATRESYRKPSTQHSTATSGQNPQSRMVLCTQSLTVHDFTDTFTSLWCATVSCTNRVGLIPDNHMACSFVSLPADRY